MGKCGLRSAGSVSSLGLLRLRRPFRGCWLASVLCLGLSAGCAQQHDNRFVYVRGTIPRPLLKAQAPGTYELFPDRSLTPRFSIDLAAGDPYGFRKREDDAIVAVAKDKEIELGDRYAPSYYWLKKNDQQGK